MNKRMAGLAIFIIVLLAACNGGQNNVTRPVVTVVVTTTPGPIAATATQLPECPGIGLHLSSDECTKAQGIAATGVALATKAAVVPATQEPVKTATPQPAAPTTIPAAAPTTAAATAPPSAPNPTITVTTYPLLCSGAANNLPLSDQTGQGRTKPWSFKVPDQAYAFVWGGKVNGETDRYRVFQPGESVNVSVSDGAFCLVDKSNANKAWNRLLWETRNNPHSTKPDCPSGWDCKPEE